MFPAIYGAIRKFFFDPIYFGSLWDKWVNKVRAAILATGALAIVPGSDFNIYLSQILSQRQVTLVGAFLMGAGVWLRAGDKTPENVKTLANAMTPPDGSPKP